MHGSGPYYPRHDAEESVRRTIDCCGVFIAPELCVPLYPQGVQVLLYSSTVDQWEGVKVSKSFSANQSGMSDGHIPTSGVPKNCTAIDPWTNHRVDTRLNY